MRAPGGHLTQPPFQRGKLRPREGNDFPKTQSKSGGGVRSTVGWPRVWCQLRGPGSPRLDGMGGRDGGVRNKGEKKQEAADRTQACCLGVERGRWEDPRPESRPPSARPAATSQGTGEPPGPSESSPALPGPWAGAELPVRRLTAGSSLSPHKLPSRWYPDSPASAEDGATVLLRVAENQHSPPKPHCSFSTVF